MRDVEKTVGNMIDKLKTAFIGSIDAEGFPNIKAMLQPRKREGAYSGAYPFTFRGLIRPQ